MSIYKDTQRGTWFFITRVKQMNGTNRQVHRRGFKTKAAAKAAEARLLLMQIDDKRLTTFEEVAKHYLASVKAQIKPSTFDKYFDDIHLHVLPYFGTYPIAQITAKQIEDWKIAHLIKGYSSKTNNNHLKRLNSIFMHGIKFFDLNQNPVKIAGGFKTNELPKEMCFWTFDEFTTFIKNIDEDKYRLLFNTLYFTGMRRGELLALQWQDLAGDCIKVTKGVSRSKDGAVISSPKTPSSIRDIVMPQFLIKAFKRYKTQLQTEYAGFNDAFFIFGDIHMLHANTLNKRFHQYMSLLPETIARIRLHDLRHSHASYLINLFNANPVAVSRRLGHKDVAETLNTYSHLYPNGQTELAREIETHVRETAREKT